MKKQYFTPNFEVEKYMLSDVISTSTNEYEPAQDENEGGFGDYNL